MPPVYVKVSDMFIPNPVVESVKETLLKVDVVPKGQGHSKTQKLITKLFYL